MNLDHAEKDRRTGAVDVYTVLGECEDWIMREHFVVTLLSNGADGWRVEWVKIETADGRMYNCAAFNAFVKENAEAVVTCEQL